MNPLFHTDFSISDSLKNVRKSVLIYETIILAAGDDPGWQEVSDQEQMEYIEMWMEKRKRKAG